MREGGRGGGGRVRGGETAGWVEGAARGDKDISAKVDRHCLSGGDWFTGGDIQAGLGGRRLRLLTD
jgi:hypothetical protein